jgi:hypothetical protein
MGTAGFNLAAESVLLQQQVSGVKSWMQGSPPVITT